MGRFKAKIREGVKEIQENSRETIELGSEMMEQADHTNAILESIELRDEEDVQGIRKTKHSYQRDYDKAFGEKIESAGQEIVNQGEQIKESIGGELNNIKSGINKLEQASAISDIGRDAAETGRSELEESFAEYEDINSNREDIVEDTNRQIESIKNTLSKIWG